MHTRCVWLFFYRDVFQWRSIVVLYDDISHNYVAKSHNAWLETYFVVQKRNYKSPVFPDRINPRSSAVEITLTCLSEISVWLLYNVISRFETVIIYFSLWRRRQKKIADDKVRKIVKMVSIVSDALTSLQENKNR